MFLPAETGGKRRGSLFHGDWPVLFEQIFNDWPVAARSNLGRFALDVEEKPESYEITANLPGATKDNIDLSLENNILTIAVRHSGEAESEDKNYLRKERWEGATQRTITLPSAANTDDVHAELKNGILMISVKKAPERQTKTIAIK